MTLAGEKMSLILAVRNRLLARFSPFLQPREKIVYRGENHTKRGAPLFGVDPEEAYFGLDWAYFKPRKVPSIGFHPAVSRPTVNRAGSVVGLKPSMTYGKSDLQETRRSLSYDGTDQRPIQGRRSGVCWDGVVRNNAGARKSYLSSRKKSEPTPRDRLTKEMTREVYSFF